jgi:hypothetical protein
MRRNIATIVCANGAAQIQALCKMAFHLVVLYDRPISMHHLPAENVQNGILAVIQLQSYSRSIVASDLRLPVYKTLGSRQHCLCGGLELRVRSSIRERQAVCGNMAKIDQALRCNYGLRRHVARLSTASPDRTR